MTILVALLPLLLIAVSGAQLFRRSVCETFAPALFLTVLVVYLCGLVGLLAASPFVVAALAVALVALWLVRKKKGAIPEDTEPVFSVGLALILAGAVFIALFARGRMVTDMDSFEQWAYVVKKMYFTHSLQSAIGQYSSTALYPPGIALFQYYVMRFSPVFQENLLFSARNLLALSLFLPLFRKLKFQQWQNILLIGFVALLTPFLEYASFDTSLEVDGMLGLLFGFVLIQGYDTEHYDLFHTLSLFLAGGMLALTKISGMLLVFISAGILLLLQLVGKRSAIRQSARRPLLPALALLAGGVVSFGAWYLFVHPSGSGATDLSGFLSGGGLARYQKETIVNFVNELFAGESGGIAGLSPVAWLFALPLLGAILASLLNKSKAREAQITLLALLSSGGYFVWLGALLLGYLTSFVPGEAISLAAFPRYLSTYQLGILLLVIHWLISAIESRENAGAHRLLALFACVLALLAPLDHVFFATVGSPYQNDKSVEFRARYAPSSRYYSELTDPSVKICFLDQTEQEPGYSFALYQFEALPVNVAKAGAWRLGNPYYDTDYYSKALTPEEWEQDLIDGGFTHLYLKNTNAYFIQNYGSLFVNVSDIQPGSYYTLALNNGHVQFTRIAVNG